mgnify:FL=1|jgi:hypothetical protein
MRAEVIACTAPPARRLLGGTPFATWGGAPAVGQPADEPDVAPAVSRLIDDSGIGTQPGRLRVS